MLLVLAISTISHPTTAGLNHAHRAAEKGSTVAGHVGRRRLASDERNGWDRVVCPSSFHDGSVLHPINALVTGAD